MMSCKSLSVSLLLAIAIAIAAATASAAAPDAPDAQQLLVASDAIRNPGRPFSVAVTMTEFQAGKQVDTSTVVTYSRSETQGGQFASLVRFLLPARETGKLMLKNGNDMWFFDPSTRASVRLSPQQRLMGQASNGDVVTVNLAKDYRASLLAEEEIKDGEGHPRRSYKLGLAATAADVTYSAIEMWIDAENNRPIKARFLTESGRLLKTAYYRKYQPQLGAERPTETVIIDGLDPKSVTLMRFSDYLARPIPDAWMQRDYLPRFQPE